MGGFDFQQLISAFIVLFAVIDIFCLTDRLFLRRRYVAQVVSG